VFSHTTVEYPTWEYDVMSYHKFQHRGLKNVVIVLKHDNRKVL